MRMKKNKAISSEIISEVLEEYVEYDRVADFIDLLKIHPDADWYNAYTLYRKAKRNHIILNEAWSTIFRFLRGKYNPSCKDILS